MESSFPDNEIPAEGVKGSNISQFRETREVDCLVQRLVEGGRSLRTCYQGVSAGDAASSCPAVIVKVIKDDVNTLSCIIERYQEIPALLDPVLPRILNECCVLLYDLISEILRGTLSKRQSADCSCVSALDGSRNDLSDSAHHLKNITQWIMDSTTILFVLPYVCSKTRGYKTVLRSMPHAVHMLESLTNFLHLVELDDWQTERKVIGLNSGFGAEELPFNAQSHDGQGEQVFLLINGFSVSLDSRQLWCTKYVIQLWLSLLVLCPFRLNTMDSLNNQVEQKGSTLLHRIMSIGFKHLASPGKERDGAAIMLSRLFSRPDMYANTGAFELFCSETLERLPKLLCRPYEGPDFTTPSLTFDSQTNDPALLATGILQTLHETLKHGSRTDLLPFSARLYQCIVVNLGTNGKGQPSLTSNSRKHRLGCATRLALLLLPQRVATWRYRRGARVLSLGACKRHTDESKQVISDEQPQDGNSDADMDVPEEVDEIIGALLSGLEDPCTVVRWAAAKGIGRIAMQLTEEYSCQILDSIIELFESKAADISYQGGCLALAEMVRRGLLLPSCLSQIIPIVTVALRYEERRGFHTVGSNVRDAACYVCWALGRAYSPEHVKPYIAELAVALVEVCVFDKEINCRRAASAAIQEQVGRQGLFPDGIELVTATDYFAIATTRGAFFKVAPLLATYPRYTRPLLACLITSKLRHPSLELRTIAANSIFLILDRIFNSAEQCDNGLIESTSAYILQEVIPSLLQVCLAKTETLTDNETRHGAILGLSAIVNGFSARIDQELQVELRNLVPRLERQRVYCGKGGEMLRQAVCTFVEAVSVASTWNFKTATTKRYIQTLLEAVRHFSDRVQVAGIEALRCLSLNHMSVAEGCELGEQLLELLGDPRQNIVSRRGYILALGQLPAETLLQISNQTLRILCLECQRLGHHINPEFKDAQARQYAILSLIKLLSSLVETNRRRSEEYSLTHEKTSSFRQSAPTDRSAARRQKPLASSTGSLPGPTETWNLLVNTLCESMNDYEADRRGDVGSWVREIAMEASCYLLENLPLYPEEVGHKMDLPCILSGSPSSGAVTSLIRSMVRLCFDKLDRTRARAGFLLYRLTRDPANAYALHTIPFQSCWPVNRILHGYSYELPLYLGSETGTSGHTIFMDGGDDPTTAIKKTERAMKLCPSIRLLRECLEPINASCLEILKRQYSINQEKGIGDVSVLLGGAAVCGAHTEDCTGPKLPVKRGNQGNASRICTLEPTEGRGVIGGNAQGGEAQRISRGTFLVLRLPVWADSSVTYPLMLRLLESTQFSASVMNGLCASLTCAEGVEHLVTAALWSNVSSDVRLRADSMVQLFAKELTAKLRSAYIKPPPKRESDEKLCCSHQAGGSDRNADQGSFTIVAVRSNLSRLGATYLWFKALIENDYCMDDPGFFLSCVETQIRATENSEDERYSSQCRSFALLKIYSDMLSKLSTSASFSRLHRLRTLSIIITLLLRHSMPRVRADAALKCYSQLQGLDSYSELFAKEEDLDEFTELLIACRWDSTDDRTETISRLAVLAATGEL